MTVIGEAVKKILVVEDNPFMSKLLELRLKANDYEVSSVRSAQRILEKAGEFKPDLVLLDVNIPVIDGFQAAQMLKAHEETKAIALIFVSAEGSQKEMLKAFQIGAQAYIIKPFTPERLLKEIANALRKKENHDAKDHL